LLSFMIRERSLSSGLLTPEKCGVVDGGELFTTMVW
jgi:hypothetical protein